MIKLIFTAAIYSVALVGTTAHAQAAPKGNAKLAAADKNAMCIGCHSIPGYKAVFPETYHVPMIYGQSEQYLYNALQAYKKGDRKHPTMRSIAASLSDQDMADLAAYYAAGPIAAK